MEPLRVHGTQICEVYIVIAAHGSSATSPPQAMQSSFRMIGNCQHKLQSWSEAAVFESLLTTSSCAWLPLPCLAVLQCQRKPEPFPYGLCLESSCFIECSSRGFRVRLEKWTRIAGFCLLNGFVHFEVQCSFVVQFKRGCSRSSAWHLRALLCSAASISLLFTRAQENGSLLWQAALFHCCYLLAARVSGFTQLFGCFFFFFF